MLALVGQYILIAPPLFSKVPNTKAVKPAAQLAVCAPSPYRRTSNTSATSGTICTSQIQKACTLAQHLSPIISTTGRTIPILAMYI